MVDALAVLLIVLPPLDWLAAVLLTGIARQNPHVMALRERAFAAVICAIVASLAGLLAWTRLGFLSLPPGASLFLIALGLVLASVPSLYWLLLVATGKFRVGER